MAYELKGTVHSVGEIVQKGQYEVREMILKIDGQYPEHLKIEGFGDKCKLFDGLAIGQIVTCHINLKGRLWNETAFNSLQIWKIEK